MAKLVYILFQSGHQALGLQNKRAKFKQYIAGFTGGLMDQIV